MLMAAGIEVPQQRRHPRLPAAGEHKMSKSLGNVIEPFQVAERLRRRRAALLRPPRGELRRGRRGLAEGFETRYNTELANEYGNLASRTLAMIERYRDGVVPTAEPPPELAAEFDGLAEARREQHRRGGADRRARRDLARASSGSTATCRTRSPGSSPRTRPTPSASTRCSTRSPRACAWCRCCCTRSCRTRPSGCSRALGREELSLDGARASARRPAGPRSASSAQLFPRVEAETPAA